MPVPTVYWKEYPVAHRSQLLKVCEVEQKGIKVQLETIRDTVVDAIEVAAAGMYIGRQATQNTANLVKSTPVAEAPELASKAESTFTNPNAQFVGNAKSAALNWKLPAAGVRHWMLVPFTLPAKLAGGLIPVIPYSFRPWNPL